jgi:hypothetical protein
MSMVHFTETPQDWGSALPGFEIASILLMEDPEFNNLFSNRIVLHIARMRRLVRRRSRNLLWILHSTVILRSTARTILVGSS